MVSNKHASTGSNKVIPASDVKNLGMLSILLSPEEVRIGFLHLATELVISVLEGAQRRVITSGIGQGTAVATPGGLCGGSGDCRTNCCEDSTKQKRLVEHIEERHLADWEARGNMLGGLGKEQKPGSPKMSGGCFIASGTAGP